MKEEINLRVVEYQLGITYYIRLECKRGYIDMEKPYWDSLSDKKKSLIISILDEK